MSSAAGWRRLGWPAEPPGAAVDGAGLPADFCLTVSCSFSKACSCVFLPVFDLSGAVFCPVVYHLLLGIFLLPNQLHSAHSLWQVRFHKLYGNVSEMSAFCHTQMVSAAGFKIQGEERVVVWAPHFLGLCLARLSGETVLPAIHLTHLFCLSIELTYEIGGSTAETIPKPIVAEL